MDQSPHGPEDGGAGGAAAVWLARKARLAAALAVIKSRPPGLSGREHAETLASRLRSTADGWRSRARELQEEVLRLRQQLLLAKMAAQMRDAGRASGDDVFLSQDPGLPADMEGPMMDWDSGCGTETLLPHVDRVDHVVPGAPHTDPVNPSVSVNHQDFTSEPPRLFPPPQTRTPQGGSMQGHMQFLQSLCVLRRAGDRGVHRGGPAWFGPPQGDSSVMDDSLRQLLGSVVAAVCSADPPPPLPSGDLVLEACQVLAGATDAWCSHRQPSPQFVADVDASLKELVGLLFHGDRLGKGPGPGDHLTRYLILLGESRLLRSLLVRHLLSLVHGLAERLCHLCQVEEHSEPEEDVLHHYENSFHLFWVLEKLLQQRVEVGGAGVTQDHEGCLGPQNPQGSQEREAFLGLLGSRVLLLSDEFPLFALYMWRVGALLSW